MLAAGNAAWQGHRDEHWKIGAPPQPDQDTLPAPHCFARSRKENYQCSVADAAPTSQKALQAARDAARLRSSPPHRAPCPAWGNNSAHPFQANNSYPHQHGRRRQQDGPIWRANQGHTRHLLHRAHRSGSSFLGHVPSRALHPFTKTRCSV